MPAKRGHVAIDARMPSPVPPAMPSAGKKRAASGSKKSKRAWRKADIADIEEHLAAQRKEDAAGGAVAHRSDEQLFFKDTAIAPLSRRGQQRRLTRVDEILRGTARVLAPPRSQATTKLRSKAEAALIAKKTRVVLKAKDVPRTAAADVASSGSYDLWGAATPPQATPVPPVRVPADADPVYLAPVVKKPVRRPATVDQKPLMSLIVPSVEPDAEGASYNPPVEAHQALLLKAVDEEKRRRAREARHGKALNIEQHERTQTAEQRRIYASIVDDIARALEPPTAEELAEMEAPASGTAEVAHTKPQAERKTKAQRAKEQREREKERALKEQREQRRREQELNRIRKLKGEVEAEAAARGERAAAQFAAKPKLPRLSKQRFVEPPVAVKTTDELPGALRQLKTESNLLKERYVSLQRRAIIEPRVRAGKGKAVQVKAFTKRRAVVDL